MIHKNEHQYFYLQSKKDFISNTKKHTVKTNTHRSQSLLSSFTLFRNRLLVCRHFDINSDLCLTCLRHLDFLL